jgi:predicted Zn-dependent peptidase
MSSRLFIQLRERRGLAYYVRSGTEEYHDAGSFAAQAGVEPKNIDESIKVILNEFSQLANKTPGSEELNKAKESIKGRLVLELEDSREVSTMIGLQELLEQEIRTPEKIMAEIDKVSAEDVTEVSKKLFNNKDLNFAVIGPFKEEDRFIKSLKF